MQPSSISSINRLSYHEKREMYSRLIPQRIKDLFHLSSYLIDEQGNDLLRLNCAPGSSSAELGLRHIYDFPDPIFYGHIADTINGQVHVLLYALNDPNSPRFDVDRLPDGTPTQFGTQHRNLEAELSAMQAGLAPGQIRQGLHTLGLGLQSFERFVNGLGHDLFFVEPLYYHNAIIFERYGFSYERGRKLMESIQKGFGPKGGFRSRLDGTTPFRSPEAANSIRLRSWAIHDGILGEPYTNVTMYKRVGKSFGLTTCLDCPW